MSTGSPSHPIVCIVDDAQWCDTASLQTIAFAARRVANERAAFVFVARDPATVPALSTVERLRLGPLNDVAARDLLAATRVVPMDPEVANRIVVEARGNPLARLELSDTRPDLVGADTDAADQSSAMERAFAQRVQRLADSERRYVTLAAAEPLGDPRLLDRAARIAGVTAADARAAEDAELLAIGSHVRFRHPLVRAAAYSLASPAERRAAHATLAQATDADLHPDRYAWHMASATTPPDEAVAVLLENSADRAKARGGLSTAGAFLARVRAHGLRSTGPPQITQGRSRLPERG